MGDPVNADPADVTGTIRDDELVVVKVEVDVDGVVATVEVVDEVLGSALGDAFVAEIVVGEVVEAVDRFDDAAGVAASFADAGLGNVSAKASCAKA